MVKILSIKPVVKGRMSRRTPSQSSLMICWKCVAASVIMPLSAGSVPLHFISVTFVSVMCVFHTFAYTLLYNARQLFYIRRLTFNETDLIKGSLHCMASRYTNYKTERPLSQYCNGTSKESNFSSHNKTNTCSYFALMTARASELINR